MAEVRIKDIDEHEIDTILADDIDFEGQLTFKKPLMIKGKFKGEIRSESALYVGEKAVVEAKIESSLVSSKGRIKGDITGHSRVELSSTAHVDGDISTPDFVVESGCKFNGHCNMGGQKKAAPQHPQGQPQGQHGQPQRAPQGPHGQPAQAQPQSPAPQQPQGQRPAGQQPSGQQPPGQQPNPQSPQQGGNR
jgi:cytoskeletal protein CcmA (bactofilin family)